MRSLVRKSAWVFSFLVTAALITLILYRFIENALLFETIILSCLLTGSLSLILEYLFQGIKANSARAQTTALLVLLAFNLQFFSLMMIDRSKSLYLVQWIGECGSISEGNLFIAVSESLSQNDYDYLHRRIEEQKLRGVIELNEKSELELSKVGKFIFQVSNSIATVYGLNGWNSSSISQSKSCTGS